MTTQTRFLHPTRPPLTLHGAGPDPVHASAVVFDLDGVLVDSESAWVETERRAVEELGGRWDPVHTDDLAGSAPAAANLALAARCGLSGREDELGAAIHRIGQEVFTQQVKPMPGALEMVRAAAVLAPVAIATNASRGLAEASVAATGLDLLIPVLISVSDVAAGKPAPDVYLAAAAALDVDPCSCLAIDDTYTGLSAAVTAGMQTLAFGPPPKTPDGILGVIPTWPDVTLLGGR